MQPRDDVIAADARQRQQYREQLTAWEQATQSLRAEMAALLAEKREQLRKQALGKFRPEIQQAVLMPEGQRTPYQWQIALIAEKQLQHAEKGVQAKLPEDKKKLYQELERQLTAGETKRPAALPVAMALTDIGREAPPTHRLAGGDWRKPRQEVKPAFLEALGDATPDTRLPSNIASTGRRAALARWLTSQDHPLTGRVLVNRLWQHHFGVGIVGTPNDFGVQGDRPTHPELLDWLAVEFVERGWSLKTMHRLMVTSATYCQSSLVDRGSPQHAAAYAFDRDNKLLWHARRQRLEGETLRDAMLGLSGELNLRMFGPSARPKLPAGISNYAWKPDERVEDQNRRSIYLFAKRNVRQPILEAFDQPDSLTPCAAPRKVIARGVIIPASVTIPPPTGVDCDEPSRVMRNMVP